MDFAQQREEVFQRLKQTNRCQKLHLAERQRLRLEHYEEVWQVTSELGLPDNPVSEITLILAFPYEFPLQIPSVYLSKPDHERLGYLPHINAKGSVCIYETETTVINSNSTDAPYQIVRQCLRDARSLLEREWSNKPTADYQTEIIAYWDDNYSRKDAVQTGLLVLSSAAIDPQRSFVGFLLKSPLAGFSLIVHQEGEEAERVKLFLTERSYTIDEHPIYYFGEVANLAPPFNWANRDVIQFINQHFSSQIQLYYRYLNRTNLTVGLFSTITNGKSVLFGWYHQPLGNRKGYRNTVKLGDAIQSYAQPEPVIRLTFETLSQERLQLRTDGLLEEQSFRFGLAGLGSIGSNLTSFLCNFPVNEFRLVEPQVLKLENINRHLLGLTYVGQAKADALADHLLSHNPLRSVLVRKDSVIKVIDQEPSFFAGMDALFVAIGKDTIEQYIVASQQQGKLTLPLFLFWIEPYAIAGHMIYIPVGSTLTYADLFTTGYYNYNAVAKSDYEKKENRFLMKEAGCQTSYLPYSQEFVTLFLARLFPEVRRLLRQPVVRALAFTWLGNIDAAIQHGLHLSGFIEGHQANDLIITELDS